MMSQLASGFSSANLRSFFSPIRKYLDASSMESVYFCQIGISFVFKYSTSCKFARPLSEDGIAKNKRQKTDGCWHSSTGISPRPMLMGAAHDALRASNARVSLTCLYVIAHRLPHLFYGPVLSLSCLAGGPSCGLATGSWRTGRPAPRRQIVSVCLMLRRRPPAGLSLSRSYNGTPRGKENTQRPALDQLRSKSRIEIISFASSRPRRSSSTWGRGQPSGP